MIFLKDDWETTAQQIYSSRGKIMTQMENYLRSTPTIDSDSESIKQQAQKVVKRHETIIDRAKSLFYFVRDEIKYNMYRPIKRLEDFKASEILNRREGNCIQKAVVLSTLARSVGIPARLGFADFRNHRITKEHLEQFGTDLFLNGYSDLFLEGKWVKATPALDMETCKEQRFIPVEFDGKQDAKFPSHDLDGNRHVEYVRQHGHYEDLPLEEIHARWAQFYGADFINSHGNPS
jgi:transglutaminase-like putative cysteine protease